MLGKFAGTFVLALVTGLLTIFVLCPSFVAPNIGGIRGGVLTPQEWMAAFAKWCFWAILVCFISLVVWIYGSAKLYPISFSGANTQMSYWILHLIPPVIVAIAGIMLLPAINQGWFIAAMTVFLPMLLQFWISSILFSPYRSSVPGGRMIS